MLLIEANQVCDCGEGHYLNLGDIGIKELDKSARHCQVRGKTR